jgi:hypothetical protein
MLLEHSCCWSTPKVAEVTEPGTCKMRMTEKSPRQRPSNSSFVLGHCPLSPDMDAMFLTAGTTRKSICLPIAYVE